MTVTTSSETTTVTKKVRVLAVIQGLVTVPHAIQVASLVGVAEGYIGQRCRGGGLQSDTSAKHARFAAACALNALLCEQSAVVVERQWGLPSTLTQQGQE